MISYRVPKLKPLKVLGRGKGEVLEFKNLKRSPAATLFSLGTWQPAEPCNPEPRVTGAVAGQFIDDCLGTHINFRRCD